MRKAKEEKKFKEKYITLDIKNNNYKVRVPGFKAVIFKSAEEAIEERNRLLKAKDDGRISIDPNITVGEWIELFLNNHCGNCKPSTIEGYLTDIERCCEPLYDIPVKDCKTKDVDNIILGLCKKGAAKSTVKRTRNILHKLFNTLIKKNYLPANLVPGPSFTEITDNMITENENSIERQAFTKEALKSLVETAKTFDSKNKDKCKKYAAAMSILINTGMRISEFLALTKNNVGVSTDKSYAKIYVRHSLRPLKKNKEDESKCWTIGKPKNKNSYREITIYDADAIESICYLSGLKHDSAIQDGKIYDFLFATNAGNPVRISNFEGTFRKIREKANAYKDVPNKMGTKTIRHYICVHEIRHSVATILAHISEPKEYPTIAAMLGHTVPVFLSTYVHATDESKETIAKRFSSMMSA